MYIVVYDCAACFSTFFIDYRPYSSQKFLIFLCTTSTFFANKNNYCLVSQRILHQCCCAPQLSVIVSIHCASLSAMFNPLHSKTNQELYEKHPCNQRAS